MKVSLTPFSALKKIIFALIFVLISACGDQKYHVQGSQIEIYGIMISAGYCKSEVDCINKELLFTEFGDGVRFSVYGIENDEVIADIVAAFVLEHSKKTPKIPASIRFFELNKEQMLGLNSFTKRPKYELRIEP